MKEIALVLTTMAWWGVALYVLSRPANYFLENKGQFKALFSVYSVLSGILALLLFQP